MKPKDSWPVDVFRKAHLAYPAEVGKHGLYGVAFFGHGQPAGIKITTESVWRGLCRKILKEHTNA